MPRISPKTRMNRVISYINSCKDPNFARINLQRLETLSFIANLFPDSIFWTTIKEEIKPVMDMNRQLLSATSHNGVM